MQKAQRDAAGLVYSSLQQIGWSLSVLGGGRPIALHRLCHSPSYYLAFARVLSRQHQWCNVVTGRSVQLIRCECVAPQDVPRTSLLGEAMVNSLNACSCDQVLPCSHATLPHSKCLPPDAKERGSGTQHFVSSNPKQPLACSATHEECMHDFSRYAIHVLLQQHAGSVQGSLPAAHLHGTATPAFCSCGMGSDSPMERLRLVCAHHMQCIVQCMSLLSFYMLAE